jgi:hypothetical protein
MGENPNLLEGRKILLERDGKVLQGQSGVIAAFGSKDSLSCWLPTSR